MERSCYRCGAQVEEHTAFCSSCGAPQIKVATTATEASGDSAFPAPVPPPPAAPQPLPHSVLPPAEIAWRRFFRIALPFALINAAALIFPGIPAILVFVLGVAISIGRYRRIHPGPFLVSHGARLGAFTGLLSFLVLLVFNAIELLANPGEYRHQVLLLIQQQAAANADPRVQQAAQFIATPQGLIVFSALLVLFTLVLCVLFSSIVGAVTAAFSSRKNRGY